MQIARIVLYCTLFGISGGAHALCVMPDGSLDDVSMSPGTIAMDMVPPCAVSGPAAENGQPATTPMAQNQKAPDKVGAQVKTRQEDGKVTSAGRL